MRLINPNFAQNLWQITWNAQGETYPVPPAPFRPAWWTEENINGKSTPAMIRQLAHAARHGGDLSRVFDKPMMDKMRFVGRLDSFPGERLPVDTLLMLDYESGIETQFPEMLCERTRDITDHYVQYPPANWYGNDDYAIPWAAKLDENAFYCATRSWKRDDRMVAMSGDYLLAELYLSEVSADVIVENPNAQQDQEEQEIRAFLLNSANMACVYPEKKILALLWGAYAFPPNNLIPPATARRVMRDVMALFDGAIVWETRGHNQQFITEMPLLLNDPLHRFDGQGGWNPD